MGSKRVLIVEDDPAIREGLKEVLEIEGFSAETASNGKEALEISEQAGNNICLILLDLMMPVMNGIQFLEAKQKHARLASVPVVVITASHGEPALTAATKAEGVLKKPIDLNVLMKFVRKYCVHKNDS